jgi:hypothetical protein
MHEEGRKPGIVLTSLKYEEHWGYRNLCSWQFISVPTMTWHRARGRPSIFDAAISLTLPMVVLVANIVGSCADDADFA